MPLPRFILSALQLSPLALLLIQQGCLKRTLTITTQPEGAIVWLNDVEVGRTPLETDFTFYGTYDVRIRREGYEAIITKRKAESPISEAPVVDFFAEIAPWQIHNRTDWHWDLELVAENSVAKQQAESELITRANELRAQIPPRVVPEAKPAEPSTPDAVPATEPSPSPAP